ncbi:MAG: 5-oxoprolinase [Chloroflexi bacterium]|nr:MAG: 5-oxoprolinase [Chloroflexota bacterium]
MPDELDPITFDLVRSTLESIVDDMALTIVRTAYSNVVRDNMDFSTGFCNRHGELVAQGLTIPMHLGSVPDAMAAMRAALGDELAPGDIWTMNDPYEGGMHLPDIYVVKPIFTSDERLVGYAVTIAHHTDVGGRVAGSNASDSTEIYQEGLRIPPVHLYQRGQPNRTLFRLIEKNVRVPDKVFGDLNAQIAACRLGEARFLELLAAHGERQLERYLTELLDYSERRVRQEIRAIPDGTYVFEDHIDDDGIDPDPLTIRVALTVRDDTIHADFAGTTPQVKGAINATFSVTRSMVYAAVRCVLSPDIPNNAGMFRSITISAPEASLVNPVVPASCAARGLTGFRLGDTLLGALAQAVPERVFAAGEGGNTGISIGGYDAQRNPFIYVEFICGCWGGRMTKDGIDGVTNPFSDLSNNPIEMTEAEYPLLIEAYELVPDSGGAGRQRGGMGVRKRFRFTEREAVLQVRSDRQRFRPYGLDGGQPGAAGRNLLIQNGVAQVTSSKLTTLIHAGDVFDHVQAGGGGYGDPLERDPALVAHDVREGRVSPERAREDYGVVLTPGTVEVDAAATLNERGQRAAGGIAG